MNATGRRKLIMAGITTDLCLIFPALNAVAEGFEAYAVIDTSGCWSRQVERAAIQRLVMGGVQPINWAAVGAELQKDGWDVGRRPEMMAVYAEHVGPMQLIQQRWASTERISGEMWLHAPSS